MPERPEPARSGRRPGGSQPRPARRPAGRPGQRGRYADREDHNRRNWWPRRTRPAGQRGRYADREITTRRAGPSASTLTPARSVRRPRGSKRRDRDEGLGELCGQRGRYADREDHDPAARARTVSETLPARPVRRLRGSQRGVLTARCPFTSQRVGTPTARITTCPPPRPRSLPQPARSYADREDATSGRPGCWPGNPVPARSVTPTRGSQQGRQIRHPQRPVQRGRYADREDHDPTSGAVTRATSYQRGRYADREDHNGCPIRMSATDGKASAVGSPTASSSRVD